MKIDDRVVVVTGAAAGIGRALARRFASAGARTVVVADIDAEGAAVVAAAIGGEARTVDVADAGAIEALVAHCLEAHGRIDLFCSNAGVIAGAGLGETSGGPFADARAWRTSFDVNVMSQVHAARAVLPSMLERGEGYLLNTASAAGLLTDIASLPYAVSKHASVALSEWLAIAYRERGIRVSCLCPMGVRTPMLEAAIAGGLGHHLRADAIDADAVAEHVLEAIGDERFLILPHPEVAEYLRRKATDRDRWLDGMRRLRRRLYPQRDP